MPSNGTPIRFAALIRVSTEQQAAEGESLRTQHTQIEDAIRELGGTVAGWYGGQEHATAGWEKKEIARLLADAVKDRPPFDAIMVTHADRWSRENKASQSGLELLKEKRLRFFVLSQEHNLFDPSAEMFLAMSAVIGGYQAKLQRKKSLESRIHRAKRGLPACGKRPFGRIWDKKVGQWQIEPSKQKLMEQVARRYLAGESMARLAEELGQNHASMHKTLTKRCGDSWVQEFCSKELDINEAVATPIPRLLPQETIDAVLAKVDANKTYTHGQIKHKYLLGRMVFCSTCGYAMFGQVNRHGHLYYRHAHSKRKHTCDASTGYLRADVLDEAVLRRLFEVFGNPAAVERAIEQAVPDLDAVRQAEQRRAELDALIEKEKKGRQNVLTLVQSGRVAVEEAEQTLEASQEKIAHLQHEYDRLSASVASIPSVAEVKEAARAVAAAASKFRRPSKAFVRASARIGLANSDFSRMTWDDKRDLLQRVFGGRMPDGNRAGVYLEWPNGKEGRTVRYTLRGLISQTGLLRLNEGGDTVPPDPEQATAHRQGEVTKSALHCTATGLPAHPIHGEHPPTHR